MAKSITVIETDVFTKRIVKMLEDETYAALQAELVKDPPRGRSFREPVVCAKSAWLHGEKASAVARA